MAMFFVIPTAPVNVGPQIYHAQRGFVLEAELQRKFAGTIEDHMGK